MDKFIDKACEALEDIERSDSWNLMNDRDRKIISELVDLKKNLLKVESLENGSDDAGYSRDGDYSNRGRRRDSIGRFSSDGNSRNGGYSRDEDYSRDGDYSNRSRRGRYSRSSYSMDGSKQEMMNHIDEMMESATDDRTREMIRAFKEKIERA